jgi:clan AA aspartic protease
MIIGKVNTNREAIITLTVLGANQQRQEITAVVDTGYTEFLTLPSSIIITLGLTWYMQQECIIGDGSVSMFNLYEASAIWDGRVRTIEINESETFPLVGMSRLRRLDHPKSPQRSRLLFARAAHYMALRLECGANDPCPESLSVV